MDNFVEVIPENTLSELREVCRYQLLKYPEISNLPLKKRTKNILKKIVKRDIKIDRFFWPNGLLAMALEQTHKNNNDQSDLNCLIEYHDKWIEKGLTLHHLDNVINGYTMIYVYEKTKDIKYRNALNSIAEYVLKHPRDKYNSLPYRIKQSNSTSHIYIDSLGMICPFLCRYGNLIGNNEMINIGIEQLKNFINYGFDEKKKLPYHAYNAESKSQFGIIGWGRAVGWILIGLIDSLEYIDSKHEEYTFLSNSFNEIVNTVIEYQHNDGYFSWQLEALGGPIDTSSTSMIAYAIAKGIKIGVLNDSYNKNIEKCVIALYKSTKNGHVENCSAECRGLSMYPQQYGWFPWSQGPTTALISIFS